MDHITKQKALEILETNVDKPSCMRGSSSMSLFFAIHDIRSVMLFYRPSESMPKIFKEEFDYFFQNKEREKLILRDKLSDAVGDLEGKIHFIYLDKDPNEFNTYDPAFSLSLCCALLNSDDESGAFYLKCFEKIADILGVEINSSLDPLGWLEPQGPPLSGPAI